MKRVLVTGASGAIGIKVIKYLLSEGKYEITALDLRSKDNQKKLRKYRRRVNLIFGDINDNVLMEALVKDQDYIIHLAGVLPPLADIKKDISRLVEYNGTENIIKAINFYNPECFLIYASSTTLYGDISEASVTSKINILPIDYYSNNKKKCEKLIQSKLKNYTILRLPLVLCNPKSGAFMYNGKRNRMVEAITDNDAAYLFVSAINHGKELNRKIFNATGGESMRDTYANILANVLNIYGLSIKYLANLFFMDKNFYTHIYTDGDKLNDILEFRSDSLSSYYMRLKRTKKGRYLAILMAKPFVFILRHEQKIKNIITKPWRFLVRKKNK